MIEDGAWWKLDHEELIAKGGLYKALYEKQFAGALWLTSRSRKQMLTCRQISSLKQC